ncbi:hypothetical protein CAEBREN_32689 [Caenorhabditis brenneri]|uniref:F-box domain-containing protein n=1 Tax=Caenorhabditis brenneri TaxID=135651 RepID=G0MEE9_CAEBE|nr:hypothetical protein CAEBREN_32689 [Caenorhabditis brenneri]
MKLLKLPYLVQKKVLKQMMYEELFLMSFLSKRSMRMVQSVKRKEIMKIEIYIWGAFYRFSAGSDKRAIVTLYQESYPTDKALRKSISLGNLACSMEYKQQVLPHYPSLVIYSRFPETDTIATIVDDQLSALFGNYVIFEMSINDRYNVLPTFLNVTRTTMVFREPVNAHVLDDYFMNVQEQKYLNITIKELIGNLSSNSKFYNTQKLEIKCTDRSLTTDILSNFKGKELILNAPSDIDNEICQFVERWKSCQELKDFAFMQLVTGLPENTNIDDIKQKSGFKDLTPEADAFGKAPGTLVASYPSYVVRDDGIIAKTFINKRLFLFYVQSFTEEQMLKGTEVTI